MKKTTTLTSDKPTSNFFACSDGIAVFLLVICSLHCLISSFELNVNSGLVIIASALFAGVFSAICALVESNKKYALCIGVIFAFFILVVLFSYGSLAAQLNYVVNTILKKYSAFLNVVSSVRFAGVTNQATGLFVVISAFLSGLLTFFLMRMRFMFPVASIPIIVIIPCFILVNTLPSLLPLLGLFVVLFTLFVSSALHRINAPHTPAVVSVTSVCMAVLVTIVYIFNPLEGYERSVWQDDLLAFTRASLGLESEDGLLSSVTAHTTNIDKNVNLSNSGPVKKTNKKVMTITSPYKGRIYLRGVAYANYENNTWSLLTDDQAAGHPKDYSSLTMTQTFDDTRALMNIITEKSEAVIYTPYFLHSVPASGTAVFDVFVKNHDKAQNYNVIFQPYSLEPKYIDDSIIIDDEADEFYYTEGIYSYKEYAPQLSGDRFYFPKDSASIAYTDFVYDNYLSVPANVRSEMINLALENGFGYQSKDNVIESVKNFVSSSATYSLQTPRVPQGKDVALWLLKESDTGYCVHFATATTLMLRSLGIPARYVTGYCVEVPEDSYEPTIVSSDNAHAWVEYFDDEVGWVPLDATPPDFTIPVYVDLTETTQPSTTASKTEPTTTTQPTTKPDDKTTSKPTIELNAVGVVALVILGLALAVLTIIFRRRFILKSRHKKFTTGSPNKRAKHIYRYLLRITKYSFVSLPEKITDIADKARFSGKQITQKELDVITRFAKSRTKAMATDSPIFKKLYLRYILVLI